MSGVHVHVSTAESSDGQSPSSPGNEETSDGEAARERRSSLAPNAHLYSVHTSGGKVGGAHVFSPLAVAKVDGTISLVFHRPPHPQCWHFAATFPVA